MSGFDGFWADLVANGVDATVKSLGGLTDAVTLTVHGYPAYDTVTALASLHGLAAMGTGGKWTGTFRKPFTVTVTTCA